MVTTDLDSSTWLALITKIVKRLRNTYPHIDRAALESAAGEGVTVASKQFDPARSPDLLRFLSIKGFFLAADYLRDEKTTYRKRPIPIRRVKYEADYTEASWGGIRTLAEGFSYRDEENHYSELYEWVLKHIPDPLSRRIFRIRIEKGTSYSAMADQLGVTESAVCLRMQKVHRLLQRVWLREFGTCPVPPSMRS